MVDSLNLSTNGYNLYANNNQQKIAFGNTAYQATIPQNIPQQEEKKSSSWSLFKWMTIIGLGLGTAYVGVSKYQIFKNLKTLTGKIGEGNVKELKTILNDYSIDSKHTIINELLENKNLKNSDKITDLTNKIIEDKEIEKAGFFGKALNVLDKFV